MSDLSVEEKKAIAALQKVAKIWPKTLWLFSASGSLTVMQKRNGNRAMTPWNGGKGGTVDQAFAVCVIPIENDGGDY